MNEILKDKSESAIGAALEANLIEQVRLFATSPLVNYYEENNMVRLVTGLPISILNLIAGAKISEDNIEQEIQLALSPFKEQSIPMIWWVGPTTIPKDLGIHLEKEGLKKGFDMPGMFYELEMLEKKLEFPPEFIFKLVENNVLLRTWAETQSKGFEANLSFTKHIYEFEKILGTDSNSPWLRYIRFMDGVPVAVSILFQGAGVAAIFNVATVPEYRRKGIGTLMTKIPLLKARSLGYEYGVLKASPMGTHLYRKMKFKECCKIGLYYL
ncbi:MAG: GNAT family N-acetyltransferase [Candidatus Hodarchaeales archaeon]|jgi:ribosomal protein S18 acetylase RimI-like enzyme